MEAVVASISYFGRLIVGTLREWFHLFALRRETSALQNRRDELLLRLGTRYHRFLVESSSDPPRAVAETVLDLGAVLSRMAALDGERRRLREETRRYLQPAPSPDMQQIRGASAKAPPAPAARRPAFGMRPPASAQAPPLAAAPDGLDLPEDLRVGRFVPPAPDGEKCECGEVLPPSARFCQACGRPRGKAPAPPPEIAPPRKCPLCGAEIPFGAEFCPSCGGHADAEVFEM